MRCKAVLWFVLILQASLLHAGESRYVTTPVDIVVAMLDSVDVTKADMVVDLGCGDGRIPIIAAARYGVRAVGVEFDPRMVAVARRNVTRNSLSHLVSIRQGDVTQREWSSALKVVTVYLDSSLLKKLRPVLEKLPPGSRVVSHQHPIPGWESADPIEVQGHKLYRYRVERVSWRQKICGPNGCRYQDMYSSKVAGY